MSREINDGITNNGLGNASEDNGLNDDIRDLFEEYKRLKQRDKELWDHIFAEIQKLPEAQERHKIQNKMWEIEKELGLK